MYFPPYNAIGSVRAGKLAKHLLEHGHDVRIITAERTGPPKTLPLEVPLDRVLYTPWWDINGIPRALARLRRRLFGKKQHQETGAEGYAGPLAGLANGQPKSILRRIALLYQNLFNWPDARIGWLPFALLGARRRLRGWAPHIVYASSPPPTSLIIGQCLARRYGVPWVAEFRDRWTEDPYLDMERPPWRQVPERRLERYIVSSAAGIVTVSEPWARAFRSTYDRPTIVVTNGFDPSDIDAADPCLGSPGSGVLRIIYTGGIYPGRRDPSALFEALQLLEAACEMFRVEFYGTEESLVAPIAARHGVSHIIQIHPPVTYHESLAIQRRADILLLMQWDDPREQGNVPAKLFEYLAARRPILGLGLEDGVPATIIRERSAGFFSNDPHAIARQIVAWCEAKRKAGHIAPLPDSVRAGFSRDEQFGKLEGFLLELLGAREDKRASGG